MLGVLLFMAKLGIVIGIVLLNVSNAAGLMSLKRAWHEPGAYNGMLMAGALLLALSVGVIFTFSA